MKHVSYIDKDGRTVTKKEGFSWPTFWILFFLTATVGAMIYAFVKLGFSGIRAGFRAWKRNK